MEKRIVVSNNLVAEGMECTDSYHIILLIIHVWKKPRLHLLHCSFRESKQKNVLRGKQRRKKKEYAVQQSKSFSRPRSSLYQKRRTRVCLSDEDLVSGDTATSDYGGRGGYGA